MAVYKATYCYPFLNTMDTRVVATQDNNQPCQYLKCKIDSSNKRVTGYRIEIFDKENNRIFPAPSIDENNYRISPIAELQHNLDINGQTNSGINGTNLNIAFLQNNFNFTFPPDQVVNNRIYKSYNAIYYQSAYKAYYVIDDDISNTGEYIGNWLYEDGDDLHLDVLKYWDADNNQEGAWDGILNGELVLAGDIVFVKTTNEDKCGLWVIQENGNLKRYFDLNDNCINSTVILSTVSQVKVFITQGNKKHYTYYYDRVSSTFQHFIEQTADADKKLWVCYDNENSITEDKIINFKIDGGEYKWKIILYQGEGKIYNGQNNQLVSEDSLNPLETVYYISYDDLSYDWYDMTITTGSILGSTHKRIQVADSNANNCILPGEGNSEPIVIQGYYLQLVNKTFNSFIGDRVYISSYDATFGHIYPQDNANNKITWSQIADSYTNGCQIYKYSNVESDIKENIVDCVSSTNQSLYTLNCPIIDGFQTSVGSYVLLMGQTHPEENGIYKVEKDNVRWTRGSYNTWAKFIGAVIYDRNKHKNYLSQAQPGGTLYDFQSNLCIDLLCFRSSPPTNVLSGSLYFNNSTGGENSQKIGEYDGELNAWTYSSPVGGGIKYHSISNNLYFTWSGSGMTAASVPIDGSRLYFTIEKPLNLFSSKLNETVTLATDLLQSSININTDIDGYNPTIGNKILFRSGNVWASATVTNINGTVIVWGDQKIYNNDDYVRIEKGFNYGYSNIKINNSIDDLSFLITNDINTATILKNSITSTYIKPFVGLTKNSVLFFTNNRKIQMSNSDNYTKWLKIDNLNSKIWRINHGALTTPLLSYSENNCEVPFKYEIRTYFKESDENPFYSYEDPYLKLGIANGKNNYTTVDTYAKMKGSDGEYFLVWKDRISNKENFNVLNPSLTALTSRYVTLQGYYFQPQQASWESYRWTLQDVSGNIVQDTGKKYDKEMKVTFYGLSNDSTNNKNVYFAVLYVNDSLGNSLQFSIKLIVDPENNHILNIPLTAEYDKGTHSVLLKYEDIANVKPTVDGPYYSFEYSENNWPNIKHLFGDVSRPWDNSLSYNIASNENFLNITGKNGYISREITTTSILNPDYSIIDPMEYNLSSYIGDDYSNTSRYGVNYNHYLASVDDKIETSKNLLKIINSNVFDFQTVLELDDNYCGEILNVSVDGTSEKNSLELKLFLPNNFLDNNTRTENTLNSNRNKIGILLNKIDENDISTTLINSYLEDQNGEYKLFETSIDSHNYLQPSSLTEEDTKDNEYLNYSSINNLKPFYIGKYDNSELSQSTPLKLCTRHINNLCLRNGSGDSNNWSFWNDNMQFGYYDCYAAVNSANNGIIYNTWPSVNESSFSWDDGINTGNNFKEFNQVFFTNQDLSIGLVNVKSVKRHPELFKDKPLWIHITFKDIDTLYQRIDSELRIVGSGDIDSENGFTTSINQETSVLLTITIEKRW